MSKLEFESQIPSFLNVGTTLLEENLIAKEKEALLGREDGLLAILVLIS